MTARSCREDEEGRRRKGWPRDKDDGEDDHEDEDDGGDKVVVKKMKTKEKTMRMRMAVQMTGRRRMVQKITRGVVLLKKLLM